MEKIVHHIEKLIILHDYVILPEFGGFIVNSVSAKTDTQKNILTPPHKEICFNPALDHNDGLLTSAIQADENTTFRKAKNIVSEEIEELKKQLNTGEPVALGKIGWLQKNAEGLTLFTQADSYDFLPDNIGLYPVKASISEDTKDEHPIVFHITGNKSRIYRFAAAISIIVLLAMLTPVMHMHFSPYLAKINPLAFFSPDDTLPLFERLPKLYTQGDSTEESTALIDTVNSACKQPIQHQCTTPWHVIAASFTSKNEAINNARELQKKAIVPKVSIAYCSNLKKEEIELNPESETVANVDPNLTWHIVVANFETPKKAKRFVTTMSTTEKIPLACYGRNNVYRIISGSYKTQKEAANQIQKIRQNPAFANAWILHNATLLNHPVTQVKATTSNSTATPSVANKKPHVTTVSKVNTAANINPAKNKTWHVIVANFTTLPKAQAFLKQIKKSYKPGLYIYGHNTSYTVIAGSFASRKEAINKLSEIKKIKDLQNALIAQNPDLYKNYITNGSSITSKPEVKKQAPPSVPNKPLIPVTVSSCPTLQAGTWYAIVANFNTLKQAQKFANETGKRGKISLSVIKDNKLYRVIGGAFKDKETAATKIKELHQHAEFAEAWPLCKQVVR